MSLNDQIEELTNAVVSCGNLLVREAARIFRPHGITPAQFNVLNLLVLNGDSMRPSEIAQSLVVDPASTTYLMNQVEERGWIQRVDDPADRRACLVVISAEGRAKVSEVVPLYRAALAETARHLGARPHFGEALALLADLPTAAMAATEHVAAQHFPVAPATTGKVRRAETVPAAPRSRKAAAPKRKPAR